MGNRKIKDPPKYEILPKAQTVWICHERPATCDFTQIGTSSGSRKQELGPPYQHVISIDICLGIRKSRSEELFCIPCGSAKKK
jgi:uncharacterized protein YecT (DUF1311 family)